MRFRLKFVLRFFRHFSDVLRLLLLEITSFLLRLMMHNLSWWPESWWSKSHRCTRSYRSWSWWSMSNNHWRWLSMNFYRLLNYFCLMVFPLMRWRFFLSYNQHILNFILMGIRCNVDTLGLTSTLISHFLRCLYSRNLLIFVHKVLLCLTPAIIIWMHALSIVVINILIEISILYEVFLYGLSLIYNLLEEPFNSSNQTSSSLSYLFIANNTPCTT